MMKIRPSFSIIYVYVQQLCYYTILKYIVKSIVHNRITNWCDNKLKIKFRFIQFKKIDYLI